VLYGLAANQWLFKNKTSLDAYDFIKRVLAWRLLAALIKGDSIFGAGYFESRAFIELDRTEIGDVN
jgi:hypothetical protein